MNMFLSDLLNVNEGLNLFHICGPGDCTQHLGHDLADGVPAWIAFGGRDTRSRITKEVGFGIDKRKGGIGTCFDRSEAARHSRWQAGRMGMIGEGS